MSIPEKAKAHGLTVDKMMLETDSPLFFGWKDKAARKNAHKIRAFNRR